jgi:hypothetical protein
VTRPPAEPRTRVHTEIAGGAFVPRPSGPSASALPGLPVGVSRNDFDLITLRARCDSDPTNYEQRCRLHAPGLVTRARRSPLHRPSAKSTTRTMSSLNRLMRTARARSRAGSHCDNHGPFTGSRFRSGFRPRAVLCADDTVGSVVTAWSLLEPGGSSGRIYVCVSRQASRWGRKRPSVERDSCHASRCVSRCCHVVATTVDPKHDLGARAVTPS